MRDKYLCSPEDEETSAPAEEGPEEQDDVEHDDAPEGDDEGDVEHDDAPESTPEAP